MKGILTCIKNFLDVQIQQQDIMNYLNTGSSSFLKKFL